MLSQPIQLKSSSFNLELKSLLITLGIIFLVNTPLHFVKSGRVDDISGQIMLLKQTIEARQLAVSKVIKLANLSLLNPNRISAEEFQDLLQLFLDDQTSITTIELRKAKGKAPICSKPNLNGQPSRFESYREQTLFLPKQQLIDFYQPICSSGHFNAFLYLQIDLKQLMKLQLDNSSIMNHEGRIIGTIDPSFQPGELLADHHPMLWRELSVKDKSNGLIEYHSTTIIFSKLQLFDGNVAYLIRRISSSDLIPNYLYFVALLISTIVGISIYLYQLRQEKNRLSKISYYDQLSGLHNRHYLHQLENQSEIDSKFVCCIFDIDNFKVVNDNYGHDIGDQVIKRVATAIKSHTRVSDYCFRIGGEEFLVLLRTEDETSALTICNRIRSTVETMEQQPKITISGGISPVGVSLSTSLKSADEKLYQAKEQGKNKIVT